MIFSSIAPNWWAGGQKLKSYFFFPINEIVMLSVTKLSWQLSLVWISVCYWMKNGIFKTIPLLSDIVVLKENSESD